MIGWLQLAYHLSGDLFGCSVSPSTKPLEDNNDIPNLPNMRMKNKDKKKKKTYMMQFNFSLKCRG